MRRHALAILAVISLIGLGVFGSGYVAGFDATLVPKTVPRYWAVGIYQGCMTAEWGYIPWAPTGTRVQIGSVDVYIHFDWGLPNPWDALSHFEARALPTPQYIVTFPLWCLILPCTIAPTLWLRRHRRRTPRGFTVEPAVQPTIELRMK